MGLATSNGTTARASTPGLHGSSTLALTPLWRQPTVISSATTTRLRCRLSTNGMTL